MNTLSTITLSASNMKFAAAHFTLFSETKRENLHGHNFVVTARITAPLLNSGLMFDYHIFKKILAEICTQHDERLLLPAHSPYLRIELSAQEVSVKFANETLRFLPRDVLLLPIANISVENLAQYFLTLLLEKKELLEKHQIKQLAISIASSPSQAGEAFWSQ